MTAGSTPAGSAPAGSASSGSSAPIVESSLRAFSYLPVGPRSAGGKVIDLAEEFHEASKIHAPYPHQSLGPGGALLTSVADSAFALGRRSLASTGPALSLTTPRSVPADLAQLARTRRSGLPEAATRVCEADLATVLALSAGPSPGFPRCRVTPSGGALYPIDVAVVAADVTGVPAGIYFYDWAAHALVPRCQVAPEDFHTGAGGPMAPPQPAITLALVATFARTRVKYGLRGYRFALLEAGHIAQAAITTAAALGLRALPWGGFVDQAVDTALELDGIERSCVYLVAIAGEDPGSRACEAGWTQEQQ